VFCSFLGIECLSSKQKRFYVGALGIFALCNLVIFTPWDKDNIKTFYLWVFFASGVVAKLLIQLFNARWPVFVESKPPNPSILRSMGLNPPQPKQKQKQQVRTLFFFPKVLATVLFIGLVMTGVFGVYREANHNYSFQDEEDYKIGSWIRENTDHDAVFVISDHHINPAAVFAGRTSFIGYTGWASSHGYPWYERHLERNKIFHNNTPPNEITNIIMKHKISYVLFDPRARSEFKIQPQKHPYWSKLPLVYHSERYQLYDVRPASAK
jgi:hypothetical protein